MRLAERSTLSNAKIEQPSFFVAGTKDPVLQSEGGRGVRKCSAHVEIYSHRSATIGSTFVARRAGR